MIAMLARYKIAAEILAALALLAGLLYGFHRFCEAQREVGRNEVRIEWREAEVKRVEAEQKIATARQETRDLAVNQGEQREKTIAAAFASNASAIVSLRGANANYQAQLATANIETNRRFAATASTVFAECVERYNEVAKDAARLDNAARTLNDAWPK